jgi:hypothetical protein
MKLDRTAKRPGKSNRKPRTRQENAQDELTCMLAAAGLSLLLERPTVAIEQKDGTYLICEIEKDGTRRVIGRHTPVKF